MDYLYRIVSGFISTLSTTTFPIEDVQTGKMQGKNFTSTVRGACLVVLGLGARQTDRILIRPNVGIYISIIML